ncbi:hypothetical protein BU14_0203s0004 [Porphyra umbilicalis]|uniref:Squalene monooxygenase n=1 Tax=Porphyra umbilicalis TaxID=2786 RepID=A0A1X6P6E0_PORUM|nr:hypothetical protein BU14_0203s0004 [Porphyra umbilicalis]|eukprot:OSX76193.1 hypothetical protein BU14_0203s0004 [Porphyra umbilicalis]
MAWPAAAVPADARHASSPLRLQRRQCRASTPVPCRAALRPRVASTPGVRGALSPPPPDAHLTGARTPPTAPLAADGTVVHPPGGYDVIVVGAGVAGAPLAAVLAADGRRVLLIERDLAEPDRIVGELLQPGGVAALRALGLGAAVDGIDAQAIRGYGLFFGDKRTCVDYVDAAAALPAAGGGGGGGGGGKAPPPADVAGRSFHNGRFVRRLRELAAATPGVTLARGTVTSLVEDPSTGTVTGVAFRDGPAATAPVQTASAALTIACDGCFSRLRAAAVPASDCTPPIAVASRFVGLLLAAGGLPYPGHGHVVLADPAPVLFYPVSSTAVRCLVDVPPSVGAAVDLGAHMAGVIAPQLPDGLRAPFEAAVAAGGWRTMPNRTMVAAPAVRPGALLLGDAFNMRHPLTGGGMTVALSDVGLLRAALAGVPDLTDTAAVGAALGGVAAARKPLSSTINILANALYAVLSPGSAPSRVAMRAACFDYLARGGAAPPTRWRCSAACARRPTCSSATFSAWPCMGAGGRW